MKVKLSLALICLFFIFLATASSFPPDTPSIFHGIVKIDITHVERGRVQGGSGICIKKEGKVATILTAGHVVYTPDGFYAVRAWQFYPFTKPYNCTVMDRSFNPSKNNEDFAILTTCCDNAINPLPVAKNLPKVGDILYSIGCAHSAWVDMSLVYCTGIKENTIEFSPPAHPGDSGGALINLQGEVVGLILTGGERYGTAEFVPSILQEIEKRKKSGTLSSQSGQ